MRKVFPFYAVLLIFHAQAIACMPSPERFWEETPERVKKNFDGAKFVVVAKVIKVILKPAAMLPGELEQTTFRVEHSFKGQLKPGSTFNVESGTTTCGRGVLDNSWRISIPGKSPPSKPDYPKRWLIYYDPLDMPFEIQMTPLTKPVTQAKYDLEVLKRFSHQWKK